MGGINEATEVARGISEQGFLVMTAAFFLVLSAMMMVACFKWFKSIITKSMEDYGESLKELIEKTNDQNNMLSDISEGLRFRFGRRKGLQNHQEGQGREPYRRQGENLR